MRKQVWWMIIGLALGLLALLAACQGATGVTGPAGPAGTTGPQGLAGPPGPAASIPGGTGVKATISKVEIGTDRKPVVTFSITDDKGAPLQIADLDTYPRFTIAYIKEDAATGLTSYVSYIGADAKGAPFKFNGATLQPALEIVKDRPGLEALPTPAPVFPALYANFKDLGNGLYTYTFTKALPENFDKNATHAVGGQLTRTARLYTTNPVLQFVPAGGAVKVTRAVVATQSCNQCHDPLAIHGGGSRRETAYCVLCHTEQNFDANSGNTVDLKVMVHKIHRGARLPSVVAGTPYFIGSDSHNYSDGVWPQFGSGIGDIRTCTTCHGAPPAGMKAEDYAKLAPNADNWKTKPSRAACGACHDNIDWKTGKSTITGKRDHLGGPQANDNACAACHVADSGKEFDASVVGAHAIPDASKQLKGINVNIVRVTSTGPGQFPQVVFSAEDNAGKIIPKSEITSIAFNVNGPTTDYVGPATTEAAVLANILFTADGNYAYNLTRAIPSDAKGTYAVSIEARRLEYYTGNEGASANVSSASYNPVAYIPVTDTVAVPRRQVVSTEKCNVCHEKIAFHGGGRLNTGEYCQFCHNPATVDVPNLVPANLGGPFNVPPQSINFKLMIHRIHTGEELTRDFTIYRTRGVFNFNEIVFPGDRTNCSKCHVGNSYTLPLSATAADTKAPREFYSPLGPAAAACMGCHDSTTTSAHAAIMTSTSGETCAVCHGRGKDFAVETVHKR